MHGNGIDVTDSRAPHPPPQKTSVAMATSFRRARPAASPAGSDPATGGASTKSPLIGLKGTKAWTGGITLTSLGHQDLDAILGGGIPLGSCIYLQEEQWTNSLGRSLVRYYCSEALSQNHLLLIPIQHGSKTEEDTPVTLSQEESVLEDTAILPSSSAVQELLNSLPRNLHWDKERKRQEGLHSPLSSSTRPESVEMNVQLNTLVEQEEEEAGSVEETPEEGDEAEAGLEIAWQYRKEVQLARLGQIGGTRSTASSRSQSGIFCHSYDLSGRMMDQQCLTDLSLQVEPIDLPFVLRSRLRNCALHVLQKLWVKIQALLSAQPSQVVRMLFYHANATFLSILLPLLLVKIRDEQLPVVLLVVPPSYSSSVDSWDYRSNFSLRRSCDVVLETENFSTRRFYPPPPEFRDFHGLLKIVKISTLTAANSNGGGHFVDLTDTKCPVAMLYGLKRDSRKLRIQLLHIPPEEFAAGGGSVGGSGVRSGAGKNPSAVSGCAAHGSRLDF